MNHPRFVPFPSSLPEVAALALFAVLGISSLANAGGRALGLSRMEVDITVGSLESEVTATLHFLPKPAPKTRATYDLFIPVYVPTALLGDSSATKKFQPALSVERRPVRLRKGEPPASVARIDTLPGMTVVWWKALLRWPRPGETLIVDMRYFQRNAVNGQMRSCIYTPFAPDGPLSKESKVTLHTETASTALRLRSGKLKKKSGTFGKWLGGKNTSSGKSVQCLAQHRLPIIVDLVAAKK